MEKISANSITSGNYQLPPKCHRFTSRYPRNNRLRPPVAARIWCAFSSCLSSMIGLTYVQQMYNHGRWPHNGPNTAGVMPQGVRNSRSHVMEPSRAPVPSVQQQHHYSSLRASAPQGNQNMHPQRNINHHPIGGAAVTVRIVNSEILTFRLLATSSYSQPKAHIPSLHNRSKQQPWLPCRTSPSIHNILVWLPQVHRPGQGKVARLV